MNGACIDGQSLSKIAEYWLTFPGYCALIAH